MCMSNCFPMQTDHNNRTICSHPFLFYLYFPLFLTISYTVGTQIMTRVNCLMIVYLRETCWNVFAIPADRDLTSLREHRDRWLLGYLARYTEDREASCREAAWRRTRRAAAEEASGEAPACRVHTLPPPLKQKYK